MSQASLSPSDIAWCDRLTRAIGRSLTLPPEIGREDLIQEARLALWRAAQRYDPDAGAEFRTFATHAIRGALLDLVRRRGHERLHITTPLHHWLSGSTDGLERHEHSRQVLLLIARAWWYLRPAEQRILRMRYLDGLPWPEVRRRMGLTRHAARQVHDVGLINLRTYLREHGIDVYTLEW